MRKRALIACVVMLSPLVIAFFVAGGDDYYSLFSSLFAISVLIFVIDRTKPIIPITARYSPRSYSFDGNKLKLFINTFHTHDGRKYDKTVTYKIDDDTKNLILDLISSFKLMQDNPKIDLNFYENHGEWKLKRKTRDYDGFLFISFMYDFDGARQLQFMLNAKVRYGSMGIFDPVFYVDSFVFESKTVKDYAEIKNLILEKLINEDPKYTQNGGLYD